MDKGWESKRKHIFILSSSGKPIFSKHGDEQELVTVFGLLQAVVSIVLDAGDEIRCIKAGKRKIVYYTKKSLYFVCISSTGEPEIILRKQLEFMYSQVLLILTSKVHDVLRTNSSKDLRDLLGPESTRLLHAACKENITSPWIAFQVVKAFSMPLETRLSLQGALKTCVENSGAALGLLLHKDSLLGFVSNPQLALQLDTSDVILLSHFVGHSSSLRSHDQNWVPVCLPSFNSTAFLQVPHLRKLSYL